MNILDQRIEQYWEQISHELLICKEKAHLRKCLQHSEKWMTLAVFSVFTLQHWGGNRRE